MTAGTSNMSTAASSKTSFDLEPNPFEQSFAPKDSAKSVAGTGIGNATSPQILTPGGRKLPPLVLSPNVPTGWGAAQFPRTGLTPNDSSIRTGLTPGGQSFPHSLNNITMTGMGTPGSLGFTAFTPGLSSLLGTNTKEFDQQAQSNPTVNPTIPVVAPAPVVQEQALSSKQAAVEQSAVKDERQTKPKKSRKRAATKKSEIEPEPKKKAKEVPSEEPKDEENMTEEEKRRNFLERNRVAASKCRQRKKQQIVKMENDLNFYLNEYNNLTAAVDQLKEQSLLLRQLVSQNKTPAELLPQVDTLLGTINRTNYIARLRGDNPSSIIPTVQPINPTLVQQNQQRLQQQMPVGGIPADANNMQLAPQIVVMNGNGKVVGNMEQWAT
jgi:ATF/CREB family transcription factor